MSGVLVFVCVFQELIAAGKGKVGTDEDKFINILGNRSHEHLRLGVCVPFRSIIITELHSALLL